MRHVFSRALAGVCLLTGLLHSAPNGSSGLIYERIICVVPLVGAGTLDDPRRPLFAPVAGASQQTLMPAKKTKGFLDTPEIVSYASVPTDDGLQAIVVFVARDRTAFQPLLGNKLGLKLFDLRNTSIDTLLTELRKIKRNLDLTALL